MRIDVHNHIVPPRYLEATREIIVKSTPRPNLVLNWTPQSSLDSMDAACVTTAFTSISVPGLWFGNLEQTRELAIVSNDYAADMMAQYPKRFRMFAMLPLPDVDASLAEIERAFDGLGADGIGMFTNYGDIWPSDPRFAPVLEQLDARGAVVFVHPLAPQACAWMAGLRPSAVEYLFDTVRCMTALVFSGAAKKYARIRWIFCHAGGALPVMIERIVRQAAHDEQVKARIPEGPLPYFRKFFYDIAASASRDNLGALLRHVPITQILFGLDLPFIDPSATLKNFEDIHLTESERAAVEHANMQRLFPNLAA
jgi:predicted TIM-barrel fold metal-dependent hydrolase